MGKYPSTCARMQCYIHCMSKQLSAVALISFQWSSASHQLSVYWLFRPSDFGAAVLIQTIVHSLQASVMNILIMVILKLVSATLH